MPTYIILGNLTDQGIRNIKDSSKRENAFRDLCETAGARVKDAYRTMGRYDLAAIVDAPDDVTLNAILYSLGSLGNVRTETLRAFTPQETEVSPRSRSSEGLTVGTHSRTSCPDSSGPLVGFGGAMTPRQRAGVEPDHAATR
jgi:uncharacterized protein with GYD domain